MSGHSKWATIKRKKGALDAKRGRAFTKLIKEITIASRLGGGDPNGNPRLKNAILDAKAENMPKDNIERAIKRGTGELPGVNYEEAIYEGYGPHGIAILVGILTDNKNRTVAEVRSIFQKHGGNMGEAGCVAWMFAKKGLITVDAALVSEDKLMEIALDAGGEDIKTEGSHIEVVTPVDAFEAVKSRIEKEGIKINSSEITMLPSNTITLEEKEAQQMLNFMDALDDHEDVNATYANFHIPEEILLKLS